MRRFIDIISGTEPKKVPSSNLLALLEAKAYEDMLRALDTLIQQAQSVSKSPYPEQPHESLAGLSSLKTTLHDVRSAAKNLRQDRAVWYTRECRLLAAHALVTEITAIQASPDLIQKASAMTSKYKADYERATGSSSSYHGSFMGNHSRFGASAARQDIVELGHTIEHWKGIPFQPLQDMVWSPTWNSVMMFREMNAAEQKFIERAKGNLALEEGDQILINFPPHGDVPRRAWILLNRASCSKEAAAMGHCGNAPRSHTQDRVLSLREFEFHKDGQDWWRPCLTFIIESDGHLGEMKGRGNQKPAAHYHDEIEALLRNDLIKGIKRGHWVSENDFKMKDLGDERHKRLAADKPELIQARERYELFGLDDKMKATIRSIYGADGYKGLMSYYKQIGIKEDDRDEMTRLHPDMRLPKEKYDADGLTDGLLKEIKNGVSGAAAAYNEDGHGHLWFGNESYFTEDFTPYTMSDDDRRKLFTLIPDAMDTAGEYWMNGLTERVAADIKEAFEQNGPKAAYDKLDLLFNQMKPEEKDQLAVAGCAPFSYMLEKNGVDDTFIEAMNEGAENWSYNLNREPEYRDVPGEKEKVFVLDEWDDTEDFIKSWGDDDFKHYASRDMDHYDPDINDDDYNVENFDDVIGEQKTKVLRDYAEKLLRDEYGFAADQEADEDDDQFEEFDEKLQSLDSWSGIYEVLGEYAEDITNAIKWAVDDGVRAGTEDEMISTREDYLKRVNSDMEYGEIVYTTHSNGEYIDNEGKVYMIMKPVDFAKYMDQVDSGFSLAFDELHKNGKIYFNEPQYGFSGFNDSTACNSFVEDYQDGLPEEVADAFENHRFGDPKNVPDDAGKKKVIADLYEKMGRTYGDIDALEGEKLDDAFKKALVYYYGH